MACRFLIFEEQLYDGKSHHLVYYSSILAAARQDETEVVLYANKEAEEVVCHRLNAIPAMWTMAGLAASGPWRLQNKFHRALLLAKHLFRNFLVCTAAVKRHRPDVVLCLSTWIPHVLLFLLVALRLGRSMPKLVLLFVWYPRIGKAKPRSFRLVRFFLRWLLKVHPQTYVFAETRYARRAWEEFLGVPVSYAVHPVEVAERRVAPEDELSEVADALHGARRSAQLSSDCPEVDYNLESTGQSTSRAKEIGVRGAAAAVLDGVSLRGGSGTEQPRHWEMPRKHIADGPKGAASRERARQSPSLQMNALDAGRSALDAPAKPVVFGFYGFARHEQGVDVLMRALEILKDKGELNAEFRIVWPKAFQMPDGSWMDREMFGHLGANVRFYENPLSPEDYLRELSETDWLILPYRVSSYEGRCSRISIEACVMGIPVIYTKGTDLEEVVRSHGEGIGVPEEDANKLADAILMAIRKNPAFKKKAVFKQAYAQADFSGNIFLGAIKK
jgi:glycosyltransferase involved in cell wall biosynthesis